MSDIFINVSSDLITAIVILGATIFWYRFVSDSSIQDYFTEKKAQPIDTLTPKNQNNNFVKTHYFKVGSTPDGNQRIDDFIKDGIVGIGWPLIGDLSDLVGKPENEIRDSIKDRILEQPDYSNIKGSYLGQVAGFFYKLLSMKSGDKILVPANGTIYIFEVISGYSYREDLADKDICHTVKINVNTIKTVNIDDMSSVVYSPKFKRALRNRLTIISLDQYVEQLERLTS